MAMSYGRTDLQLSVIIPTKNRLDFVQRAITAFGVFPEIETIVVDDGSVEQCAAEVKTFCSRRSNCRYVGNSRKSGAAGARNTGFLLSRGHHVWFFDDDDGVPSETIKQVLVQAEQANHLNVIMLLPASVRWEGQELCIVDPSAFEQSFDRYRSRGQSMNTSCAIFPRSVIDSVGLWDEAMGGGDDTDLFLRCSIICEFVCLDAKPVEVNIGHAQRFSTAVLRQQVSKLRFLRKHWNVLSIRRRMYYLLTFLLCAPLFNRIVYKTVTAPMIRRTRLKALRDLERQSPFP